MRYKATGIVLAWLVIVAMVALESCNGADDPENIEPTLMLAEARDVTRTEATLGAVVERHGPATLTYVRFVYAPEGAPETMSDNLEPDAEGRVSLRLTGLRPGATYIYYAIGGTSTASLRSEPLSFVTQPNDKPKVGPVAALSTGPLSIIVGFEVIDDGGEPLTGAGCYVREVATGLESRQELAADQLTEGSHRLCISSLKVDNEYEITPFASNSAGETLGETFSYTTRNSIVLEEAGQFALLFGGDAAGSLDELTVSGPMNGDDFHLLRLMLGAPVAESETKPGVKVSRVDLSDVVITEGGASYDGQRYIEADVLSTGLFAGCVDLLSITLPATALQLQRNALLDCSGLTTLTIPAGVTEVLPSLGCSLLKSIEVSEANTSYSSYQGVLYSRDLTQIVWFPEGKEDAFTLPSNVTEISEGAFKNIPVKTLIIPETVKTISRGAFAGSSLEEITLPDDLTNVSGSMFQDCSSLRVVRLGSKVNFLGDYAFDGCQLTDLYITAEIPPYVSGNAFTDRSWDLLNKCTLHVPSASRSRYRSHARWGKFVKIVADD
ncbi:MAG: leucine-rich repeat domain-containing protein [Bacteroides sp.]|nr:leucine-rich repeat domain-containing protein [Bacteroides sp.]